MAWTDAARAASAAARRAHSKYKSSYKGVTFSGELHAYTSVDHRKNLASALRKIRKGKFTSRNRTSMLIGSAAQSTAMRNQLRRTSSIGRKV